MAISKQEFSHSIKQFKLRELFNEMGWDQDRTAHSFIIDGETFQLKAVAQKSGLKILSCELNEIPHSDIRNKLDTQIKKLFFHYIVVFYTKENRFLWMIPIEKNAKRELTYLELTDKQDSEFLFQKVSQLTFALEEEEKLTIVDVSKKVNDIFVVNSEKITKQFYDRFKQHHTAFLKFIKGIDNKVNQEWYASLMLNRLMFCYFIQKKGFLDNNKNYLSDKLKECQDKKGKDKFYSFYRSFLLQLFHHGLGAPDHSKTLIAEIGNIPYLNGGLFDTHEIEKDYKDKIEIDDKAFEGIFKFFNEWEWHLDTRHTASGRDINPDVIGYIFEKYINDRADMGAYYTKEDITDYISKNCILPFLFDETKRQQPKAFYADATIWKAVKESSDKYIYNAVKKGAEEKLPKEIEDGIKNISARTEWNKSATENFALPTEIWREVVDRRNRYTEIKTKIKKGEVTSINDFISYNLNIRQFTIDSIANTNDPEFLKAFYKSLNSVTIIDPTCGSGAFLFAAMNILEELYELCIQRMQNFVKDAPKGKYKFFEEIIIQVTAPEHPNLQYFIFKNIILRNLYGVDIMKEAVEIAKLRLFLKLVAAVEVNYRKPNLGLEPLPDIDFNIRSGNTLVGFATEAELKKGLAYTLDGVIAQPVIEEKCDVVAKAFSRYKEIQLTYGDDYKTFKKAKDDLRKRLRELNHELNLLLHKQTQGIKYDKWLESYKPFHWFAEFYEIVGSNKGFDVIIGNPPYVEYSAVKKYYTLKDFKCLKSGNLYAYVIERSYQIMKAKSRIGMIIQMSAFCTPRMEDFQKIWFKKSAQSYISFFDDRPGKLFDGLEHIRVSICISEFGNTENKSVGTTNYIKFKTEFRPSLFENLSYVLNDNSRKDSSVLKVNSKFEHNIIEKIWRHKTNLGFYLTEIPNNNFVYYGYGYGYFGKILNYQSYFKGEKVKSSTGDKFVFVNKDYDRDVVVALMNSTLFYWFYSNYSDGHNFTKHVISSIPFSFPEKGIANKLKGLTKRLMQDLESNSNRKVAFYKATGKVEYDEYFPKKSKAIINEVDTVLADHYGFSDEELDFIINYDIKYRMGKELESDE